MPRITLKLSDEQHARIRAACGDETAVYRGKMVYFLLDAIRNELIWAEDVAAKQAERGGKVAPTRPDLHPGRQFGASQPSPGQPPGSF